MKSLLSGRGELHGGFRTLWAAALLLLAACGGGGGGEAANASATNSTPTPSATPGATVSSTALEIEVLELAQTHVLPESGKQWAIPDDEGDVVTEASLHFTGGRGALALVALSPSDATAPALEGWIGGARLGAVSLAPPSEIPPTEDGGPAYAGDRHSADVPASWMHPGLELRVVADDHLPSTRRAVEIGADFAMTLRVLPFYVFGATEANTLPLAATGAPDAATADEIFAKWPVASLDASNHPAGKVSWPSLVIGPRADSGGVRRAAYVASTTDDYKDGFAGLSAALGVLGGLRNANGEGPAPVQYYAPLLALDASGRFREAGGGLGGGSVGAGDTRYGGIFIHEQGHAFGLPHVGGAYDEHRYPYAWGSLLGSAWGYDVNLRELLAPFVPPSASRFAGCGDDTFGGHPRAEDEEGRCVKQDPMQSGAGDQSSHHRFATFSDYSTAVMQRWLEGTTTATPDGSHDYDGGRIVRDESSPGGYRRWDAIDRAWVDHTPVTADGGIFGLDGGLPIERDVPVQAIVVTLSHAGTAGVTQIYPSLPFTGNLLRSFDPTSAADRAAIVPNTGLYYWYCHNGGCDYTLRLTYADSSRRHVLLQGGFRPFFSPHGTPEAAASDPLDGASFRRWVVNVPDDGTITRIELLETPMAWQGLPASPTVLASR